jgi:hypothetical protein
MQIHAEHTHAQKSLKPIPNPRGTQTVPQPGPVTPRSPDGRFTSPFRPVAAPTRP